MSILTLFILLTFASIFVALILPHTFFGRSSFYLAILAAGGAMIALCSGCSTTTLTEYDKDGNVTKVTETDQSAFAIAMTSIQTKDNFLHGSFWAVGVNPTTSTYGIGAGDFVAGSINKENGAVNATAYSTMINASKVTLDITANKEGISAKATTNENETSTTDPHAGSGTTEGN